MGNNSTKLAPELPREFSLANKKLKLDTSLDVEEYVQVIQGIKNLTVVSLNGNTIGVEAGKALADSLRSHKTLKEVNLSDCFTGRLKEEVPLALEAFCKVFMTLPDLSKVDFSDNAFGPIGAKAVYEYLSSAVALKELRLNNNGLGPEGGKLIAEALSNCAQASKDAGHSPNLLCLSIGRNRLENASTESLAKALELQCNIEELSLYQNGIRPEGIATIASALIKCPKLHYIDLQDNTFTESGSMAMSSALVNLIRLNHINLGDCLMGATGASAVFSALCSGDHPIISNLGYLNLQYNEIDEDCASLIAKKISLMTNLKHLFLNGNNFKSAGPSAKAILVSLKQISKEDVVDEWDDMEADLESEEEEESEGEEELTKALQSLKV